MGFTLIELLVVVLIIGILSAAALPQYEKAVLKTRIVRLMPLLRSISDAENLYYMSTGSFTLDFSDLTLDMPAGAAAVQPHAVRYKDFYCYLRTGNESRAGSYSAYCNSTHAKAPELEKYFLSDNFICWGGKNETALQVCRSVSGQTQPTASTGVEGGKTGFVF